MSSRHPSEPDSCTADSVTSTPRSDHPPPPPGRWNHDDPQPPRVRLMCSFGGRILPRPHDNQLRYVGGETRIVAVQRNTGFSALLAKLAKLSGTCDVDVKYQLPHEDLDSLISVTTDEDVENMMEEFDRLTTVRGANTNRTPRLRLFLFPPGFGSGGLGSVLDGSTKRDHWFLDALNGGAVSGSLERGRSEVSSIMSEMPDYLFGLDNNLDEPKAKNRQVLGSDTGSPVAAVSSPVYYSTSSAPSVRPIPDLPPVKTKPENPDLPPGPDANREMPVEEPVQNLTGYSGNQVWQCVPEPVRYYYIPGPIPAGNLQGHPVPVGYGQGITMAGGGQIPMGYQQAVHGVMSGPARPGAVYMGGPPMAPPGLAGPYNTPPPAAEGYDYQAGVVADGSHYAARNPGTVPVYATPGIPHGGELQAAGTEIRPEAKVGRVSP